MGTEFTPEEIAAEIERRHRDNDPNYRPRRRRARPESPAIDTATGVPKCPRCGNSQFKARRTVGQRLGIGAIAALTLPVSAGAGGLAAAKGIRQKVQCVTCGTFYDRIK